MSEEMQPHSAAVNPTGGGGGGGEGDTGGSPQSEKSPNAQYQAQQAFPPAGSGNNAPPTTVAAEHYLSYSSFQTPFQQQQQQAAAAAAAGGFWGGNNQQSADIGGPSPPGPAGQWPRNNSSDNTNSLMQTFQHMGSADPSQPQPPTAFGMESLFNQSPAAISPYTPSFFSPGIPSFSPGLASPAYFSPLDWSAAGQPAGAAWMNSQFNAAAAASFAFPGGSSFGAGNSGLDGAQQMGSANSSGSGASLKNLTNAMGSLSMRGAENGSGANHSGNSLQMHHLMQAVPLHSLSPDMPSPDSPGFATGLGATDSGAFCTFNNTGGGGGGPKSWASIASAPAKPGSMPKNQQQMQHSYQNNYQQRPMQPHQGLDIGTWGSNGYQSSVPVPYPPDDGVSRKKPYSAQGSKNRGPPPPPIMGIGNHHGVMNSAAGPMRPPMSYSAAGGAVKYNPGQQQQSQHPPPPQHMRNFHPHQQPPQVTSQGDNGVLEQLKSAHNFNPAVFDCNPHNAKFFIIKSYSEDDIHRSIKYGIWCSTEHGNKKLDAAYRAMTGKGPVYLFYSVNGSGHFCGLAEMTTEVDYSTQAGVWEQDKWKGRFDVKWIFIKDVPNAHFRHIRLESNENKPVTQSRDTQEVPLEKGRMMLKILSEFKSKTSIFDDFNHYENRQKEQEIYQSTAKVR